MKNFNTNILTDEQEIIIFENVAKTIMNNKLQGKEIETFFDFDSRTFAKFMISFEKYKWFDYELGFEFLALIESFLHSFIELNHTKKLFFQRLQQGDITFHKSNDINSDYNNDNSNDQDLDTDLDDDSEWWKK